MKDLGPALHGIAGIVIGGLAIFGFAREVLQHDWALSPWQLAEALAWPAGGAAALAVGLVVLAQIKKRKEKQ